MKDANFILGAVAVMLLILSIGPLLVIWSLNTLFPVLAIGYTFWNWLAAFLLMLFFSNSTPHVKATG